MSHQVVGLTPLLASTLCPSYHLVGTLCAPTDINVRPFCTTSSVYNNYKFPDSSHTLCCKKCQCTDEFHVCRWHFRKNTAGVKMGSNKYQCVPLLYNFLCIQKQISMRKQQPVARQRFLDTNHTFCCKNVLLASAYLNVPRCKCKPTGSFLKWDSLCSVTDINVLLCAGCNQASN